MSTQLKILIGFMMLLAVGSITQMKLLSQIGYSPDLKHLEWNIHFWLWWIWQYGRDVDGFYDEHCQFEWIVFDMWICIYFSLTFQWVLHPQKFLMDDMYDIVNSLRSSGSSSTENLMDVWYCIVMSEIVKFFIHRESGGWYIWNCYFIKEVVKFFVHRESDGWCIWYCLFIKEIDK